MSTATATTEIDHWRIVAPWYRWERLDGLEPERAEEAPRPALHKFQSTDFIEEFLADPQRSVAFDAGRDVVQEIEPVPNLTFVSDGPKRSIASIRHRPSSRRKLFLPAHQRFYLVAVGLHCDRPGFPKVDPAKIGEVGLVIRRRNLTVPSEAKAEGAKLLRSFNQTRSQANAERALAAAKRRSRLLHPFSSGHRDRVGSVSMAAKQAAGDAELAKRKLLVWAAEAGVEHETAAWVPTGEGSFGEWIPMAPDPVEVVERSYSMRRLAPDPNDPNHAAHDGTVFYATVPTASDEMTVGGSSRFNELDTYEIRVFARLDCGNCPGPIVWSEPTEPFRLASFYDPDGSAQRPLEIRLPNFEDLEASAAMPSVRMTAPENSGLDFAKGGAFPMPGAGTTEPAEEICFFSIPLITIVALFLLNLVLPIVMLVFNLFWMLKLKFCIPPSFEAELSAAFDASVDMTLELAVELDIDVDVDARVHPDSRDALKAALTDGYNDPRLAATPEWQVGDAVLGDPAPKFTTNALFGVAKRSGAGASSDGSPSFSVPFTHREPVTRDQVKPPVVAAQEPVPA